MLDEKITFDRVARWGIVLLLSAVAVWLINRLSTVLLPFFAAWLMAYMMYPLVHFLQNKCRLRNRVLSIIVAFILVCGVIAGALALIIPPVVEESVRISELIKIYFHDTLIETGLWKQVEDVFYEYAKGWRYKEAAFAVYLVILLMPMQVTLVPNYITADLLGLLNSYWAIILPAIFHPLGVFLLRLQMKGFDKAWVEAAQDCGASEWQIFRRVILPNLRPGIMVMLVLTVAEYWNIIDQAIVFLDSTVKQPLSVSLSQMLAEESGIFFAASCIYVLPVLRVFGMGKATTK